MGANEITQLVRPDTNLQFELIVHAPVLAYGFGTSSCLPEISVRVVCRRTPEQAIAHRRWKKLQQMLKSNSRALEKDSSDHNIEVIAIWTWSKFQSRLELMHIVYGTWSADPAAFTVDVWNDPWVEYGPGDTSDLWHQYERDLDELRRQLHNKIERLHELEEHPARSAKIEKELTLEKERLQEELKAVGMQLEAERRSGRIDRQASADKDALQEELKAVRTQLDSERRSGKIDRQALLDIDALQEELNAVRTQLEAERRSGKIDRQASLDKEALQEELRKLRNQLEEERRQSDRSGAKERQLALDNQSLQEELKAVRIQLDAERRTRQPGPAWTPVSKASPGGAGGSSMQALRCLELAKANRSLMGTLFQMQTSHSIYSPGLQSVADASI